MADPRSRMQTHPIVFRGVVEIERLDWLSPRGKALVLEDLRQRDIKIHSHTANHPTSDLTLEAVYRRDPVIRSTGKGRTIKLLIQGEKRMTALFMTCKFGQSVGPLSPTLTSWILSGYNAHGAAPHDRRQVSLNCIAFMLHHPHARSRARRYEVASMNIELFNLSQNFLTRYRLVAAMRFIVDFDPDKTKIEHRDINYFVDGYMARCAAGYETDDAHSLRPSHINYQKRLIFNPAHSADGTASKPRHLRRLHRSEITGLFAAHAEWILHDQLNLSPQKKFLDIESWAAFCRTVAADRRQAKAQGIRWGRASAEDSDTDGTDGEVDFARVGLPAAQEKIFRDRLEDTLRNMRKKARASSLAKNRKKVWACTLLLSNHSFIWAQQAASVAPSVSDHESPMEVEVEMEATFDSDFSVPSSSSAPSSSDEDGDSEPPNPDIAALLPPEIWVPPRLPGYDFRWRCPVDRCSYVIDMLHLTAENTRSLRPNTALLLQKKRWTNLTSSPVLNAFHDMVDDHYKDHLARVGLHFIPGRVRSFNRVTR